MKYRIAQIIPYFGKWPEWIDLYFYSCGQNPIIDFIFYTDCEIPEIHADNLIFNKYTYEEYSELISNRLNINYNNSNPYKLTDLKPFLGYIHDQELKEYDFWGFGDIDLVYGDLSKLINDEMLDRYDLITTHNYHIAGHFCLCRNNEYYKNACFKINNWKSKVLANNHYGLDEGEWSGLVCKYLRLIRILHRYILSNLNVDLLKALDFFNPIFHKKMHLKEYFTSLQPKEGQIWTVNPEEAKVTDFLGRELPYLHFLFFKKTKWLDTDLYWRSDFYKISLPIYKYKYIIIDYKGIIGIKYDKE